MTDKRLISAEMLSDEFYISLNLLGRQLWFGLIIAAADDQGRFQDNAALIRSKVFPADEIETIDIKEQIEIFIRAGKIYRYIKNGKKLLQIVNWWKHQNQQYPAASKYEAPDGWTDRVRRKISDKEYQTINWDKKGGFEVLPELPSQLEDTYDDTLDHSYDHRYNRRYNDSMGYRYPIKKKIEIKKKKEINSFSYEKEIPSNSLTRIENGDALDGESHDILTIDSSEELEEYDDLGEESHDSLTINFEDDSESDRYQGYSEGDAERREKKSALSAGGSLVSNAAQGGNAAAKPKVLKREYGEFRNVRLSDNELDNLKARFPDSWDQRIEPLSEYKQSKGKRYKSDYATILTWARKDEIKPITQNMIQSRKERPLSFAELAEIKKAEALANGEPW